MNVSVHGAKTQLSKLLDLVEDGEQVVLERHGRPVGGSYRFAGTGPRRLARCAGSSTWPKAGSGRSPMKKPKRSGAGARSTHLLDTSTLLWALGSPERLSAPCAPP